MGEEVLFANELYADAGSDPVTVSVPQSVEFEVKVEREGSRGGPSELGVELELEWDENGDATESSGGLSIE